MSTYTELLKSPQWISLRDRHRARTKSTCEDCGAKEIPVDIHHRVYGRRLKPWDYPDDNFVVVCHPCHRTREEIADMARTIFQVLDPATAHKFLSRLLHSKGALADTCGRMTKNMEVGV